MKAIKTLVAVAATALLASCSCTNPVTATSNTVGNKCGQSTATTFLSVLCFNGDCSIDTAAKKGGIKKISHVDQKVFNVLGLFQTTTTIVYGE
ncbi:MAG: TRL-like family protein [Bacteroidaceae bacterium]|nr:TRL-like family protein [Bacteroidaceae bacterium]